MDDVLKDELARAVEETAAAEECAEENPVERRAWAEGTGDAIGFLLQVSEELNSTLELDAVLRKVAERVRETVCYDTFGLLLLDPLGQELRIHFGIGYPREVQEHWRFGLGQGLVGTAAQTGQAIRSSDVRRDPRYINAGEGICSEMAIPLIVKNRVVGVLDVGSRQCNYFTESHQRLLTLLAGRVATAIENARLYENLQQQARALSLLHEVSRELASLLDREQLLSRVAKLTKRLVDYHGFHVMLWNPATQLLEHAFSLRFDERIAIKRGLPLGTGITGTAAALRQSLRVPNVDADPRYVRCGDAVEVRSELVAPLVFKERLLGVIDLESTSYNAFTEQHEQMLSTLASYVAIALENTRLYEKVSEDEQRLENDLETARDIQKGLLPEAAPRVPGLDIGFGYEPARQLGGDIYDFLPYGDGRLAVAVGDVAGKGAAAALYGSLAIGMLRGHVVEHPCEPAEMLEQLNHHLRHPRLGSRYVAMAYAIYNSASKILTLGNAGFPRPWLVRGGHAEPVSVEGVPLGLLGDTRYEQKSLALLPGDVVVFCSDGIHECMDKELQEFGSGRVEALLTELASSAAVQVAHGILRATDRYAASNGGPRDDRTVVVLKVLRE